MIYNFTSTRMAITQKTDNNKDVETLEPSYTAEGEYKTMQPLWKTVGQSLKKLNIQMPYNPTNNSIPKYIPKKINTICPPRNVYTNVHSSMIQNSQKVKITQTFSNR